MKNILILCLALSAAPSASWAQEARQLGGGVILGDPIGGTAKLWLDRNQAVDFGVGGSGNAVVYGDWLWHAWNAFKRPAKGKLAPYVGLGLRIEADDDAQFGFRTVAGVSYWLEGSPIELFGEMAPIFNLTPDAAVGIDGGVGVRFYFKTR